MLISDYPTQEREGPVTRSRSPSPNAISPRRSVPKSPPRRKTPAKDSASKSQQQIDPLKRPSPNTLEELESTLKNDVVNATGGARGLQDMKKSLLIDIAPPDPDFDAHVNVNELCEFTDTRDKTKIIWHVSADYLQSFFTEASGTTRIQSKMFNTVNGLSWTIDLLFETKKENTLTVGVVKRAPTLQLLLKCHSAVDDEKKRTANFMLKIDNITLGIKDKLENTKDFSSKKSEFGYKVSLPNLIKTENDLLQGCFIIEATIRPTRPNSYNSRLETGYSGLINCGSTCYMNSLLQTLYHISEFTRTVYQMPADHESEAKYKLASTLQQLFYNLKHNQKSISTLDLIVI
jgi:hypothetical protein